MLKKTGKWVLILLGAGIAVGGVRAIPLLFPYPVFTHEATIEGFILYADSGIDDATLSQLNDIINRVKQSTLFKSSRKHRIFLCGQEKTYAFFSRLAGRNKFSQGINVEPIGNIFISKSFVQSIQARYGPAYAHTLLEGSLSHVVAHEAVHTLITDHLGYFKSKKLPHWKKEGYAEFIASNASLMAPESHAQLAWEYERYLAIDKRRISPIRLEYLKAKLMVYYLIKVKNMQVETIFLPSTDEETVANDLASWYEAYKARAG